MEGGWLGGGQRGKTTSDSRGREHRASQYHNDSLLRFSLMLACLRSNWRHGFGVEDLQLQPRETSFLSIGCSQGAGVSYFPSPPSLFEPWGCEQGHPIFFGGALDAGESQIHVRCISGFLWGTRGRGENKCISLDSDGMLMVSFDDPSVHDVRVLCVQSHAEPCPW